jgi:hypothetical protein
VLVTLIIKEFRVRQEVIDWYLDLAEVLVTGKGVKK